MFVNAPLFRSLASLHRAGISWPQAMASASAGNPRLEGVQSALAGGAPLSDAMAPVIDPLDLALLRAGEHTGRLDEALDRIAERHDATYREKGTRRNTLIYPVAVAHVAAVMLPLPEFIQGKGAGALVWSLAVLAPVYLLLFLSRRRKAPADAHPGTRMPRARGLMTSAVEEADARALNALADCTDGGIPVNETMELTCKAGPGGRVAWDIYRSMPAVKEGAPFLAAWTAVPEAYREELAMAEQAGELGDAARRLATRLRFDVEMRRQKIAKLVPLGMMLAIGGVIAWRVIGFYTQMYSGLGRY